VPEVAKPTTTVWALEDVSFDVRRGEVLGVIGRNGSGKSTLLKILSRITTPTRGNARVRGRVGSLLEVGVGFHLELSGRDNIYLSGATLGMRRAEIQRRFDEIVEFSQIGKFLDTPAKYYSSGMYMRLAFSVAAHLQSEILMVDEVLAVGDFDFQNKCIQKMREITRSGRTVLFVSHSTQSIESLCDRAILLAEGKLKCAGDVATVLEGYLPKQKVSNVGSVSWGDRESAPSSRCVTLQSVIVSTADGEPRGEFEIGDDIHVRIAFWNKRPNTPYRVRIHLRDQDGSWVFSTQSSSDERPGESLLAGPCPEGLFESSCTIPGNLLNDHTYAVSAEIIPLTPETVNETLREDGVLTFKVADHDALPHAMPFLGAVRPRLQWRAEHKRSA
jgi:lipopolysaccharide transport system ATP-binding protein